MMYGTYEHPKVTASVTPEEDEDGLWYVAYLRPLTNDDRVILQFSSRDNGIARDVARGTLLGFLNGIGDREAVFKAQEWLR